MPIHEFQHTPPEPVRPHLNEWSGGPQLAHVTGRAPSFHTPLQSDPDFIQEFMSPGFRYLDEALKLFFSGIKIPTKDSFRFLRIKIAGGDKSTLYSHDEMLDGRVRLPVASLSRTTYEPNREKFSPPYTPMYKRYLTQRFDRAAVIFRPVQYLVGYELSVRTQNKPDGEHILQQILTLFNPLAEFVAIDGHYSAPVQLRLDGSSDASEKEVAHDAKPKIKYDFKMTAEAWLSLPEKVVPTILGHVGSIQETVFQDTLFGFRGSSAPFFEITES